MPNKDRWDERADRVKDTVYNATSSPGKATWTIAKWLMIIMVVMIPLGLLTGVINFGGDVASEVFDPKKVVYTYEQFHRDYTSIQSFDVQYQTAKSTHDTFKETIGNDRAKYADADRQMLNMYVQSMVGLRNERNRLAAEYNAKSAMITRDIFKGTSLPRTLSMIP